MAIQTKSYILSTTVTSDLFPEKRQRMNASFDQAITGVDALLDAAQYITGFSYGLYDNLIGFQGYPTEFIDKVVDFNRRNNITETNDAFFGGGDMRIIAYVYSNLAYCYLVYEAYYDDDVRKRFPRDLFKKSYNLFESLKTTIGNKGMNIGNAISSELFGIYSTEGATKWKEAWRELYKNAYNKTNLNKNYSKESFIKDLKQAKADFTSLKELFNNPQWGITRLWLGDSKSYGPYLSFQSALINTLDDAETVLGIYPKDNPTTAEIDNAMVQAKTLGIDLSFRAAKLCISKMHDDGLPFGFCLVPNEIDNNIKDISNALFFTTDNINYIKSDDATDIEKLDYCSKLIVRQDNDKDIAPFPKGNDNTITGGVVGNEIPNQAELEEAAKLSQTPPVKEEVDREAIQEQTERFLAQQNAGLNSTQIQGIIVDGRILEETDEVVPIGECFLKEVIDGEAQTRVYTSSLEGRINIPEFGKQSVLRIIPPPPFQQKDFGPNEGDDNEIDFVYEIFAEPNTVNTSGGQLLDEVIIESGPEIVEEELDPRQVGGTVINAITSEPVAGINVSYGIGRRKVTTITNESGEFIIKISEPRINQLGQRLDKISEQIKQAQERTIDVQKTFFAGQQFINENIDRLGSSGTEQLENAANNLQQNDTAISQYSSNVLTGNIGLITGTETPGVISDTGVFQAGQDGKNFINQGIEGYNNTGGVTGLYGQAVLGVNQLSAKTADVTQNAINKLTDPLNSRTFQDVEQFKDKLNELQGKLPGRKIIIKGTGKVYKTTGQTTFSDNPTKEVFSEIKYRSKRITPYDSENKVIQDLGIIKINPRVIGIRNSLREIKYRDQYGNPELKLQKYREKLRDFNLFQALKREKLKQEIKRQILPNLLVQVLVPLGVTYLDPILQNVKTDINEVIRENDILCPNQKTLKKLIKTVNVLNMALTRTYTAINGATTAVKTGNSLIKVLQTAIEIFQFVPFIHAIGTPDTITKLNSDKIQKTKDDLEKGRVINENILLWIMDISVILSKAIDVIKVSQGLLERCLQETKPDRSQNQPDLVIDPVVADLQNINAFVNAQTIAPLTANSLEINGFKLEIEEETILNNPSIKSQQDKISIPRKRAIAKNGNGIIVIRGEYSFTADPDILIEELRFYIQVNDLKAF